MSVEWRIKKFTGFDPEIGREGYSDTSYSLSLQPRFRGVSQLMYGYRVFSLNPKRVIQPDHFQAVYPCDLDLPFAIVSVYVADDDEVAEWAAQRVKDNSVIYTMAEWNTVEDYLHGEIRDEEIQEMFQDPDSWRYPECLSFAFIMKTLLEKAEAISDGRPLDPERLSDLNRCFDEEVEALEIGMAA
jgi:hypothetical protein